VTIRTIEVECILNVLPWTRFALPTMVTRTSAIADKLRDAFRGQSKSPNMVPFHDMVFYYCAIETLSVGRTLFETFDLEMP